MRGVIMLVAVCNEKDIIINVLNIEYIPEPIGSEHYAECPGWCWIGYSIRKEKPAHWGEPTLEEQIRQLESDYETAKHEICKYYMDAIIEGDVDMQKDLQAELQALQEQYSADGTAVMNTNVNDEEV